MDKATDHRSTKELQHELSAGTAPARPKRKNAVSCGRSFAEFLSPISFCPPQRIVPSAWQEHAPFAFWLIEQLKPKILVELGTYLGFSFFAFCQALRATGQSAAAFAVDLWTGDEHAGFYGEDVYERVQAYLRDHYADIATLLRMSFADARDQFTDGSVDLLHIDGRHYFDDVREDFTTWLPKLSNRGIVLFHDINVHENEFGVHRLWLQLKTQYLNFSFVHGHGLGILGVGTNIPPALSNLFAASKNESLTSQIRAAYSRLGTAIVKDSSEEVIRQRAELRAAVETERATAVKAESERAQLAAILAVASEVHKSAMSQADARSHELAIALNATKAALTQASADRDHIFACLEADRAVLAQTRAERDHILQCLQSDRAALADACSERDRLLISLEAERAALSHARAQREHLSSELESERALTAQLTTEIGERECRAAQLADELASVRASADEQIAALMENERRAHDEARSLRDRLTDAEAALAKAQHDQRGAPPFLKLLSWSKRRAKRRVAESGLFDEQWYIQEYPDVAETSRSPIEHYLEEGYLRGYQPNPFFDSHWYLSQYEDVRRAGVNPLLHYIEFGAREGRDPGPGFQTTYYVEANPDVRDAGTNPLAHYLRHGRQEGRRPIM